MRGMIPGPSGAPVPAPANRAAMEYVPADYRSDWERGGIAFHEVLGVLRRHIWLILVITAAALAVAVFLVSRQKPLYQASAMIRLGDPLGAIAGGLTPSEPQAEGSKTDPFLSEIMVLKGRSVLREVVEREGLRLLAASTGAPAGFVEDVEFTTLPPEGSLVLEVDFKKDGISVRSAGKRAQAPYGSPVTLNGVRFTVPSAPPAAVASLRVVPRESAIDRIQGYLSAGTRQGTNALEVVFQSSEPTVAVRVVNAVVQVYQEVNAATARQQAIRRRSFLEGQLRENDSLLTIAQFGLSGFRSREQTYSAQTKFAAGQAGLMEVETRRAQLSADRQMYQSLLNEIVRSRKSGAETNLTTLLSTPGIASSPVVSQLQAQLVQYRNERESAITGPWAKAPTHPDVQRLNSLIASTEDRLIDAVGSHIASLAAQIVALGGLQARAASEMAGLPRAEVQEVRLLEQVETLREMGGQLRSEYQQARLEEAIEMGDVEIVDLASSAMPVQTNRSIMLLLGLVVGLLLGSGCAFVREKLNTSINSREEIHDLLQVPTLAVIPRFPAPRRRRRVLRPRLPGGNGKTRFRGMGAEAYRTLRTNLIFSQSVPTLKTLVVTSAAPEEGKTLTAVNLAVAYAQQGFRILLVDCDLRRPNLTRSFGNSGPDLTSVLLEGEDPHEAIRSSGMDGLDVLGANHSPPHPSELLGGPDMKRLVEDLAQHYDMLILDSPPLLVASDAAALAARMDGVLLVVRAGETDRGAVLQAIQQLENVGAQVLGAVLNDPDGRVPRYGGYYEYSPDPTD